MRGKLIKNPLKIIELADQKKAILFHNIRMPAAVVQNWQLRFLANQISGKHLYEYKVKKVKK